MGEPFGEVSPGFLPRTLDQLRAGVENDARRAENRLRRRRLSSEEERPEQPQQSLEDALDDLLNEASDDEAPSTEAQPVPQMAETPTNEPLEPSHPLTRREAQLQRARERFARVFGSREDIQQEDYESPLTTMYSRADDRYRQAEERRVEGTTDAPSLDGLSAQERRDIEEQLLWGVMRESQAMSESLEREGDVWSYAPVHGDNEQFDPARHLRELRTLQNASTTGPPGSNRLVYSMNGASEEALRLAFEQPQTQTTVPSTTAGPSDSILTTSSPPTAQSTRLSEVRTSFQQITSELERLRIASEALSSARHSMHARYHVDREGLTLDNQPDRPPPKTDEEMTKTLACQVCYQQLADIAVLPCGHMVMCQWCADVVIPVRHSHLPVRPSKCPMCRKQVKQRFKIHMGS